MTKIIFSENDLGCVTYKSHEGELNFELVETLMNDNSCLDDMIVYLFCDVYADKYSVDDAFEKFDELDYETEWFEKQLSKKGVTFEIAGE